MYTTDVINLVLTVLILIVSVFSLIYMVLKDRKILSFSKINVEKTEEGLIKIKCRLSNKSDFTISFEKYYILEKGGTQRLPKPSPCKYSIPPKCDILFEHLFELPGSQTVSLVIELTTGEVISKKLNLRKAHRELVFESSSE